MKYYILAAGCQMNLSDTERIKSILNDAGFSEGTEEDADILGVTACSVRQKSIDKIYSRIHKWNKRKESCPTITFLTGCVLPDDKNKFQKLFDLVLPTNDIVHLPEMIGQAGVVTPASAHAPQSEFWDVDPEYNSTFEAFIPIQNGCNNFCSYCAVPYTRGREISRPSSEIIQEFTSLVDQGFKSITLLGQNVNSYGFDHQEEPSFAELLEELGRIGDSSGKEFWLYFTAPHPKDMTNDVIEVMSRYKCIAEQVHLPIQSGDNHILKEMNRKYTREDYGRIVEEIRKKMPRAALFTDIIVGFPGEGAEEFENTKRAMELFRYNMVYLAKYSPRPGAKSAKWQDSVSAQDKKERFRILSEVLTETAREYNHEFVGNEVRVLVTGMSRDGSQTAGHTEGRINIQFPGSDSSLIGQFVTVKVTGLVNISLSGELKNLQK